MSAETAIQLFDHITGIWRSWIIATAVKLDIAERLVKQPLSIADLAKVTDTHEDSLFRLMRSLASMGIFKEDNEGKWNVTPMANLLTSSSSSCVKYHVLAFIQDWNLALPQMDQSVRTGRSVFADVYGAPYYEYLKSNAKKRINLKFAMKGHTEIFCSKIPDIYDFKRFHHIIDCGGNDGSFLIHILKSAVKSNGTVFDEAEVIEEAKLNVAKSEVSDRCSFVAGNFLECVPSGGDCYILKLVLLDWPDDHALKIISNIAKEMKPGTRMLIIQTFIPEGDEPHFAKISDPVLLCVLNGKQRTRKQFETLVHKTGLRINAFIPTGYEMIGILEAIA